MLGPELTERVAERLGITLPVEPSQASLRSIYGLWCRHVPFDNVRKLIHLRNGNSAPLPGSSADDFFEAWLKHGTGGTCWPGAGALQSLLRTLGFEAIRGIGTMLVAPDLPPNHGTVVVNFDQVRYLVDSSILHDEPLLIDEKSESHIAHPAWGVRCHIRDKRWHIAWRPLNRPDGFECRLERFGANDIEFTSLYQATRRWSPFNYQLTVRVNRDDSVIGATLGHAVTLEPDGNITRVPFTPEERIRFLVEEIGFSEEIVSELPDDLPTPPPPGSRTAQLAGG